MLYFNKREAGTTISLLILLVFAFSCFFTGAVYAADIPRPDKFPDRKIEWNLWYGPGGGTDVFSRTIGIPARKYLKPAPLVIINIPGASGANGMIYTMEQPADGYTITSIGNDLPINDVIKRVKYKGNALTTDDFVPIVRCQFDTATIQVNGKKNKKKGSPFNDINEFVAYAKKNPGKLVIGITGSAGFDEVVTAMFAEAAGIDIKILPFDSAGKIHAALLGDHIDAIFEEFGPTISLLEQGDLKALVVFKEDRVKDSRFSSIPAAPELGWDITLGRWRGIGAKVGTPPERIEYLHQVFKNAMTHPLYKSMEKSNLLDLRPGYMGPKELAEEIEKEKKIFSRVLKKLGYIK